MTQEEKTKLITALCGYLPYGLKVKIRSNDIRTVRGVNVIEGIVDFVENDTISPFGLHIENPSTLKQSVKPCLRPMSSMTDKEKHELKELTTEDLSDFGRFIKNGHGLSLDGLYMFDKLRQLDWLNQHMFDYRGLIELGLALEAPEGMYNLNNE